MNTTQEKNITTEPHVKNPHAQALGALSKGIPRTCTPEDLLRRSKQAAKMTATREARKTYLIALEQRVKDLHPELL